MKSVKMDINFLDKPLYFQNLKYNGTRVEWKDLEGYVYKSTERAPDYIDMIILLYLLMKSQSKNYTQKLCLTRYEIIKGCGFVKSRQTYNRVNESIKRWSGVNISFEGTFYDGIDYLTINFDILKGKISKATGLVEIFFDDDWLLKIRVSEYIKYINFEYYRALKRPVSRRLYEILVKTFYRRTCWPCGLIKLGFKLSLAKRAKIDGYGNKTLKMYPSDVLRVIRPAIKEINRLAKNKQIIQETGVVLNDTFTLTFEVHGENENRTIWFYRHQLAPTNKEPEKIVDNPELTPEEMAAQDWLDSIPGFNDARKQDIYELTDYLDRLPPVKEYYESMENKPGPAWVYKAIMERWSMEKEPEATTDNEYMRRGDALYKENDEIEARMLAYRKRHDFE